ncbi:hypothetical protein PHMEG_00020560 [Phytophthora megakarya]|uniref:Uncharacterized protein n=1 Tax=Phytophthora megakarya TaxID=4795 RepID=A0A225VNH2_9STRA|nr:hypothetical protein PHMEG_00020560 [Phytophthora megakarya]
MLRFYATLHWGPNVRGRTNFKCRLDAARSFEDVLSCNEPVPADALTEVGRQLVAAQAIKRLSSRCFHALKPDSERCAAGGGNSNAAAVSFAFDVAVSDAESMSIPRLTPKRKAAMSSEFRSSFRLAGGSRSDIKSLTSESSPGQSAKSSFKSKKSRPKKTGAKAKSGRPASDEYVISVSSQAESEPSSDQVSSASEGSETHEDEESELPKLRPESQCLEYLPDDTLDAPASADSKSSPKGKKKVSPKSTGKKKSSAKTKGDVFEEEIQVVTKDFSVLQEDKLVKLAQRVSDLLTPYGAPEFTTVLGQAREKLPSRVHSDAEIKCTTVGVGKFCKFMAPDNPWRKAMDLWPEDACLFDTTDFQLDSHISQRADYPERLCGVWRRLRGNVNEKQAVKSFAIYERKHWVSPEALKRFLSRLAARLSTTKDTDERRKFKVALECMKKVWFTYNKERTARADNLRTFLPGRMWPWCVCPDATLPIETLLDPTLPFYTIENLMWVPGSADWCAEAALVDKSEPFRVDWLTCPEQHPYNTVYVPCNPHVPLFLPANSTVEALGPQIVPDSSLKPEDIDSSWDRAFRVETKTKRWGKVKLQRTTLIPPPFWT